MRPLVPLVVALAGAALLSAAATFLEPPLVALADVAEHEGARVAVEGWVARVVAGARGARLDLADGAARLPVLVAGPPPARAGDAAWIVGVVSRDGAGLVLGAERVDVLAAEARSVAEIVENLADGRRVAARGVLARGALREADAALPLAFRDAPPPDGPLRAEGTLRLDRARAAFHLEVAAWTRE